MPFVGKEQRGKSAAATSSSSGTLMSTSVIGMNASTNNNASTSAAAAAAAGVISPLRIESVLPTLLGQQQRQHRRNGTGTGKSMYRSYSTLSSAYFNKKIASTITSSPPASQAQPTIAANAGTSDVAEQHHHHHQHSHQNHQQQQHHHLGAASNAPLQGQAAAVSVPSNSGFWRVQRTAKEKEKLPDRINLDRRGLTALPVIEDEPGLRLLSLQHNLINSFSVPEFVAPPVAQQSALPTKTPSPTPGQPAQQQQQQQQTAGAVGNNMAVELTQRTRRPTPAIMRNASTRNMLQLGSSGSGGNSRRSSPVPPAQQAPPAAPTFSAVPYKSAAILHVKDRINRMRKSSSFMNNSSSAAAFLGGATAQRFSAKQHMQRGAVVGSNHTPGGGLGNNAHNVDASATATSSSSAVDAIGDAAKQLTTTMTPLGDALLCVRNELGQRNQQQHLESLVFIDLYDNQIEKISNLDGLQSLTVLLLGKNRIRDISGLASVRRTLRVLDLHGNRIAALGQRISQLQELKSLNLAGNCLRQVHVDDFRGLCNLRELNLKRNRIKRLAGFEDLRSLERLWLCHNDVQRVEDMAAVAQAIQLREVTVENNPVSLGGDCVSFLVSYLPALQLLSQMPVTEQVRRAAQAWRRNKETTDASYSELTSDVCQTLRREEIISNARTNWELLRGQQQQQQHSKVTTSKRNGRQQQHAAAAIAADDADVASPTDGQSDLSSSSAKTASGSAAKATAATPATATAAERRAFSVVRQKAISSRMRDLKKADLQQSRARRRRSVSQDNYAVAPPADKLKAIDVVISASDQQLFRLPPILAPFLSVNGVGSASTPVTGAADAKSGADGGQSCSESSVGPNVDSSSASYVSSDAESPDQRDDGDEAANTNAAVTQPIDNVPVELEKDATTSSEPVTDIATAETQATEDAAPEQPPESAASKTGDAESSSTTSSSNTSTLSAASSSNASTITSTSTATKLPVASAANKSRNATALRRVHLPLARAHTAKNINLNANLTTTSTPLQNAGVGSATTRLLSPKPPYERQSSTATNSSGPSINLSTTSSSTTSSSTSSGLATNSTNTAIVEHQQQQQQRSEREREQGGDYLIEICGRYLNVYGAGAVKFIDRQWNNAKAADVHTLKFSYVHFNSIAPVLGRIKQRFPNAENFVFSETSLTTLGQLNALADVQGIQSLVVERPGNAMCEKNWRPYAIYRLSHWGVRQINGEEVREADIEAAHRMYEGLSDLVLWSLPDAVLEPLLVRLRLEETCTASRLTPKQWLLQADAALRSVVGKEALQATGHGTGPGNSGNAGGNGSGMASRNARTNTGSFAQQQQQQQQLQHHHHHHHHHADEVCATVVQRGKRHLRSMMVQTCDAVEKLQRLETLWPAMLMEFIRNTLLDYAQLDVYVRNHMAELMD